MLLCEQQQTSSRCPHAEPASVPQAEHQLKLLCMNRNSDGVTDLMLHIGDVTIFCANDRLMSQAANHAHAQHT
jgi:hypothetical protein